MLGWRRFLIALLALAMVIIPRVASASMGVRAETRIRDLQLPVPALIGAVVERDHEKHRAISPSHYDLASGRRLRWKGRWLEYSTGSGASLVELYDMRARWWWPQGGVFVAIDDFGFHDSRATFWAWPGQNPLGFSDPSGHLGVWGAAVGGLVGAVTGAVGTYIAAGGNASWQDIGVSAGVGLVGGAIGGFIEPGTGASAGLGAGLGAAGAVASGGQFWSTALSAVAGGVGGAVGALAPGSQGVLVGALVGTPASVAASLVGAELDKPGLYGQTCNMPREPPNYEQQEPVGCDPAITTCTP